MSIDVFCTRCNAHLRVPDDAAGAQAKCPHCQEVFEVEVDSVADAAKPALPPTPPGHDSAPNLAETTNPYSDPPGSRSDNPYAPPQSDVTQAPSLEQMQLGRVDPRMSLQLAWELFKANLPILLLTHGMFLLMQITTSAMSQAAEQNGQGAAVLAINLLGAVLQWFITIGLMVVTLAVARGQQVEFGAVFSGGPWFLRVAIFNILYSLMVGFGLLLLIVPGIYLALRFWPAPYFIIDRDCDVIEAFNLASTYTEGNKVASMLLVLLTMGVVIVGILAFCVGFLFAYPIVTMMWTIAYLMMTRQPVHRPAS